MRSTPPSRSRSGTSARPALRVVAGTSTPPAARPAAPRKGAARKAAGRGTRGSAGGGATPDIVEQLAAIERDGGDGILVFSPGVTLAVSSLDRPVWPKDGVTKGGLMRYYAQVAPALLPALADRPLVLKRYPAGVTGPSFHQHAPGENVPPAVRVEDVESEEGIVPRFIGGDLPTLLYTVQLGAIAVNPWHARVGDTTHPDYAVLDLDPGPRVPFSRTLKVALLVGEALDALGLRCALKTSGSRGIHLVVPLPPRTSWETAARLAEEVATRVSVEHPTVATVERALAARPKGTVYVDHLQNARGKTLASVFSARARPGAPVSTPVTWEEIAAKLDAKAFTVETVPPMLARLKRLWQGPFRSGNAAATVKAATKKGRRTS